jgi:hypothetical protein
MGGEASLVGGDENARGDRLRDFGYVEKGRVVFRLGQGISPSVDPGVHRAQPDQALGLVDVDVAVARHPQEIRNGTPHLLRKFDLRVFLRRFDLRPVAQEYDRNLGNHRQSGRVRIGLASPERRANRDHAVIAQRIVWRALRHQNRDQSAHGFTLDQHAIGWAEAADQFVTQIVEVGDRVGDDDAVAAVAGLRDDPALLDEPQVSCALRKQVSHERR